MTNRLKLTALGLATGVAGVAMAGWMGASLATGAAAEATPSGPTTPKITMATAPPQGLGATSTPSHPGVWPPPGFLLTPAPGLDGSADTATAGTMCTTSAPPGVTMHCWLSPTAPLKPYPGEVIPNTTAVPPFVNK